MRPGYSHKSNDPQFQTRSLLFIQDQRRLTTNALIISVCHYSATTQKCRSHVQSAIGCRVSTNHCVAAAAGSRPLASSVWLSPPHPPPPRYSYWIEAVKCHVVEWTLSCCVELRMSTQQWYSIWDDSCLCTYTARSRQRSVAAFSARPRQHRRSTYVCVVVMLLRAILNLV